MNVFNPSKVKINCAYNCDHCGKPFNQNDWNNNNKGASGFMYWFCGSCLHLINKHKRNEK